MGVWLTVTFGELIFSFYFFLKSLWPHFLSTRYHDNRGLYGTILDHTGPYGTTQDHRGPYRTIGNHTGPYRTIQNNRGPYQTTVDNRDHTRPYSTMSVKFWLKTFHKSSAILNIFCITNYAVFLTFSAWKTVRFLSYKGMLNTRFCCKPF